MNEDINIENKNSTNKKDRLIKLNKVKVAIITFIVLIILTGVSVGIYFAIVLNRDSAPLPKNISWTSNAKSLRSKINEKEGEEVFTGVFLGQKDEDLTEMLLYGSTNSTNKSELEGIFSQYLELEIESEIEIDWVGINYGSDIDTDKEKYDFFIKNDDDLNMPEFYDDSFYYIGQPTDDWYFTSGYESIYFDLINVNASTNEEDDAVNVEFSISPSENPSIAATPFGESTFLPTWMWFYGSDLVFVAQGAPVDQGDSESGTESTISSNLTTDFFVNMEKYLKDNRNDDGTINVPTKP